MEDCPAQNGGVLQQSVGPQGAEAKLSPGTDAAQ